MARVLIVEDEHPISNLIRMSLSKEGHTCVCSYDGTEAANQIEAEPFDLVLLDIMLPGADGFTLLEYIRPLEIPVIFITAKGSLEDRVRGLKEGAEDYLVKPFEIAELIARVEVVLRRYNRGDDELVLGDLVIDPSAHRVTISNKEVTLTKTEFDLLLILARNAGRALSREFLYESVWGGELPYGSKTVDLHVQRLRRKAGLTSKITSVNKVGYRMEL